MDSIHHLEDEELLKLDLDIKRKRSLQQAKKQKRSLKNQEIITRNSDKPHNNFSKISKWLQITILQFLDEADIIKTGSVCRSLNQAANDEFIWKHKFIQMRGEKEFVNLYQRYAGVSADSERAQKGNEYKIK